MTIYAVLDTLYTLIALTWLVCLAIDFVVGLLTLPDRASQPLPPMQPTLTVSPPPQSVGAMGVDYSQWGIRQLRIECRDRGFKGAARFTKAQCLEALSTC